MTPWSEMSEADLWQFGYAVGAAVTLLICLAFTIVALRTQDEVLLRDLVGVVLLDAFVTALWPLAAVLVVATAVSWLFAEGGDVVIWRRKP